MDTALSRKTTIRPSPTKLAPPTSIKAKLSSSANPRTGKPATTSSPRPRSPFKPQSIQAHIGSRSASRSASPTRSCLAPTLPLLTTLSTPSSPDLRHRSPDDVCTVTDRDNHTRRAGISLHHAASLSSLHARSASAIVAHPSVFNRDENGLPGITPGRVKAKVSALAQQAELGASSPNMRTIPSRVRGPSVSSSSVSHNSSSITSAHPTPTPVFYPITTATAAANPYRYATSPPGGGRHRYLPFSHSNDVGVPKSNVKFAGAKLAPSAITPPLISPPVSTLSFSSQSSVSQSSPSCHADSPTDSRASTQSFSPRADSVEGTKANGYALEEPSPVNEQPYQAQTRMMTAPRRENTGEAEDRQVKAEAKSNRKIADLEITNRSLMSINASLEAVKHRQAKEIRDLRRKLRESRLILPPPTYRAVKSTTDHNDTDDDDDDDDASDVETSDDDTYRRVKVIIEKLLETARRALESKVEDHQEGGRAGKKVLSPYEVRSWHGSFATDDSSNNLNASGIDAEAHPNGSDSGTPLHLKEVPSKIISETSTSP